MKIECTEMQKEALERIFKEVDDCPFGGFKAPECQEEHDDGTVIGCDECVAKNIIYTVR